MKRLIFETQINSYKEKIWYTLWDEETYPLWFGILSEDTIIKTNWKEGEKIYFTNPEGDGMYGIIETNKPFLEITFKHLGNLHRGRELPIKDDAKLWTGSMEHYTLSENKGVTQLTLEVDVEEDHFYFYNRVFPKALRKLKELSEG